MLDPETAWGVGDTVLQQSWLWKTYRNYLKFEHPKLHTEFAGIKLDNPVGLAAGYDKNCKLIPGLSAMGFGYLVTGTVTKEPKFGNLKPRITRRKSQNALINALGFPGNGLADAKKALIKGIKSNNGSRIFVSVSGIEIEDILECHSELEPLVDAIEVNISSPNTAGLKVFQHTTKLSELIDQINIQKKKPIMVKMPPMTQDNQKEILALAEVCVDKNIDSITVANTLPIKEKDLAVGQGGLSGGPLFDNTLRMLNIYKENFDDKIHINSCGGISNGEQAIKLLSEGATTVQLLTSLIYEGPTIVKGIKRNLSEHLIEH